VLVYGDVEAHEGTAELKAEIAYRLLGVAALPGNVDRHSRLVDAFVRAADLVTGIIDQRFAGTDTDDAASVAGMELLTRLAVAVDASWRQDHAANPLLEVLALLDRLPDMAIRTKIAEGYGFYAVYPESYAAAARNSGLPAETRVIGIRSIGASLAAMVAAGLGAAPPLTVRPTGHPFKRKLIVDTALAEAVLAGSPPAYAIVDEGPGLSGSSLGAVADWLEAHGVGRQRIHFFPSHANDPGAEASAAHLRRWREASRHLTTFDTLLLDSGRLAEAVEGLIGPMDAPLFDVGGGTWRATAFKNDAPVAPQWERRKFLAEANGRRYLVKFAGLGGEAERKLALARRLEMVPRVLGYVHGFLVEEWIEGTPLDLSFDRRRLIAQLGQYLNQRARLRAPVDAGASASVLMEMVAINVDEALGPAASAEAGRRLAKFEVDPATRVEIDGRMHSWEWVVRDGALFKTDALDHSRAHDFVGAQPLSWDIAAAVVELELTPLETATLASRLRAEGNAVPAALDPAMLAYLAFQLGAWTMSNGAESAMALRYRQLIAERLTSPPVP
jgi:hypothetical protein